MSRYRFSRGDCGLLTEEEREFFEDNGFFVVKGLLNADEIKSYRDRFQLICERKVDVPGITIMKDVAIAKTEFSNERAVTKLQDFNSDEILFGYCSLPKVVDYVHDIIGSPNIMSMHTMLINKPPDPGTQTSRHPLHQDLHYFPFRPTDRIVCAWAALEKIDRSNGCLVVLPGTHKGPLLPHGYPQWSGGVNKMYHGILADDLPFDKLVYLTMEPGDVVFFHPLLIHGSGSNRTKGFRKAISCHYASSDCHYVDISGTSQEALANEILEIADRRLKALGIKDMSLQPGFDDIWRIRCRVVRGVQSNL